MAQKSSRSRTTKTQTSSRKLTRRDVLFILAGSAGASLAGLGAFQLGSWIPTYKTKRELRQLFEERIKNPLPVKIVPEYERSLDHALMVFDNFCVDRAGEDYIQAEFYQRQYQEFSELLHTFPEYTTIHLTASPQFEQAMRDQLASLPRSIRERIVACPMGINYKGEFIQGTVTKAWAQDVVEPVLFDGRPAVVIPLNRKYNPESPITAFQNTFMPSLEKHGFHHVLAPVMFDGGNLIPTIVRGRSYLFMGSTDVGRTIAFYATTLGISLSEKDATELFKNSFGVDEVVVFGPTLDDYINMADPSGGALETYQELKKKAKPESVISVTDNTGTKLFEVFPEGDIVFWFNDRPHNFNDLTTGGILEQAAFSYHVDMVMATHPGDRISLVEIEPFTVAEVQERGQYYAQVYTRKGVAGQALVKAVEADFFRDYLFLNYTISELRRTYARLTAIYGAENIFRFPSSALHARNSQAYANTLRFRNKNTNEYSAIVPMFPTQERWVELVLEAEGYSEVTTLIDTGRPERYEQRGHNRTAKEHFEQLGYNVTPIRNTTYRGKGNTNCLVNILS